VTQVFAQGGGQCDSNPACNPNDPNGIPCCGLGSNDNHHNDQTTHDMGNDDQDHDEMNHENRRLSRQNHLPESEELRDALKECLMNRAKQEKQVHKASKLAPTTQQNCAPISPEAALRVRESMEGLRTRNLELSNALDDICNLLAESAFHADELQYMLTQSLYTSAQHSFQIPIKNKFQTITGTLFGGRTGNRIGAQGFFTTKCKALGRPTACRQDVPQGPLVCE
jgi:hypothetical protein